MILGAFALLTMAGMIFGFALPDAALAWDNCPRGVTNCAYPGLCGRYVDTNGDDICDLSQPKPAASTTTTLPVTTTETVTTSTTGTTKITAATGDLTTTIAASGEPPTGDCPLGPCIGCRACVGISTDIDEGATIAAAGGAGLVLTGSDGDGDGTTDTGAGGTLALTDDTAAGSAGDAAEQTATPTSGGASLVTHYLVAPIALAFFVIYGLSFILYKSKKIRIATHRKIWNVMLLGTFLVTGLFGLILTIQLDYTLPFTIPVDLLFWHVEAGIAMTLISLFHMGWHFNYYKNLVRNTRKKARAAREAERGERAPRTAPRTAPQRELVPGTVMTAQAREQRRADREADRLREERRVRDETAAAWRQAYPPTNPRPWLEPGTE